MPTANVDYVYVCRTHRVPTYIWLFPRITSVIPRITSVNSPVSDFTSFKLIHHFHPRILSRYSMSNFCVHRKCWIPIIFNTTGNLCIISILFDIKKTSTSKEISSQHMDHWRKKWTHPKFSGVVRNVGEKKWFPRKKAATKRGGCAQGA